MGMLERIAATLGYTKAAVNNAPAWLQATAESEQFTIPERTLPEAQSELYQRLSWVQIAVSTVARVAAITKFSVVRMNGDDAEQVVDHEFEKLLRRPNPLNSRAEFLEATFSYKALTGNAYWWMNRASANDKPQELWLLPSHKVKPIPDRRLYIRGYEYTPDGAETAMILEPWEICHFRAFHPLNSFVGLSPIEALATVASGDMAMQKWNTNYFGKDNAKLPGALAFADPVDDVAWAKIKKDTEEKHGGTKRRLMMLRNVGKGGVEWLPMSMSQTDMQFLEGRSFNKEEIYSIYAPGLASLLAVNATEANSKTGKQSFIEFGVWPQLVQVAEKISNDILPIYGDQYEGAFEDIRITDRAMDLAEQTAFAQVHTIDEVRQRFHKAKPLGDDRGKLLAAEIGKGMTDGRAPEDKPEPVQAQPFGRQPQAEQAPDVSQPDTVDMPDDAPEVDTPTKAAAKAATLKAHTGIMVALFMPPSIVAALVQAQGLLPINSEPTPANEFHLTLAYLGDMMEVTADSLLDMNLALTEFASIAGPLTGRFNGIGRFQNSETDGTDVIYASFDCKELPKWRELLVDTLAKYGFVQTSNHGFIPHITLGYVPPNAVTPMLSLPSYSFTFDTVWMAQGDNRINWPLTSAPVEDAAKAKEAKALRKWIKRRPHADVAEFDAEHLSDDEIKAIVAELKPEGAADTDFFTKATRDDGDDRKRKQLELYHADKLERALRKWQRLIVPSGTTVDNITPDLAVERMKENQKILRDAIIEMLMDGAHLGSETGIAQAEALLGVGKATITGVDWEMVNENVLQWVLGSGGGFGDGYGDELMTLLVNSSEKQIRREVHEWANNNLPFNVLVDNLSRSVFSKQRATVLAETEITRAYATANRISWRASGVISRMRWNTVASEDVCKICSPKNGTTADINGDFDGLFPPAHPRCRCFLSPVVG